MTTMPEVELENFQGPFDVVLKLVRKRQIDISEVSLGSITDSFLEYLKSTNIPLGLQADFIDVAATLLLLKVRRLVPALTEDEEEEIEDFTGRLRIYELYRDRSRWLQERWFTRPMGTSGERLVDSEAPLPTVSAAELREADCSVVRRLERRTVPTRHLRSRGRSLKECLVLFRRRLARAGVVSFDEMILTTGRGAVPMSLMAALEMARGREASLSQGTLFGPITIERGSDYD